MSTDPRIDDYIARAAPFAQPILARLRALVHEACPEVEETIKWGMPHFLWHGMLCRMAAFKQHCSFGFWRAAEVLGDDADGGAMGQFGRIRTLSDLPPGKTLAGHVRKAMALNESGRRAAAPRRAAARPEAEVPPDLAAALARRAKARGTFERLSPSHRREYVEWLTEAKRAETRARRLATTLDWLAEGKPRHWKYQRG